MQSGPTRMSDRVGGLSMIIPLLPRNRSAPPILSPALFEAAQKANELRRSISAFPLPEAVAAITLPVGSRHHF